MPMESPSPPEQPRRRKNIAKFGSPLWFKQKRAADILEATRTGRGKGWTNSRILRLVRQKHPAASLDMVNKAVAVLARQGVVVNREKGNQGGPRHKTVAKYLRVIDWRLQGESYPDIAFAEGLAEPTVKVILNRNHVRKGSIADYVPFDPSKLVTSWNKAS